MYKVKLLKEVPRGNGVFAQPGEVLEGPDVFNLIEAGLAEPANNNARRRLEMIRETTRLKQIATKRRENEKLVKAARAKEDAIQKRNAVFAERLGVEVNQPTTKPDDEAGEPEGDELVVVEIEHEDGEDEDDGRTL